MNFLMNLMPLMRNCKEVTALVIAREDRHLPMRERATLRVHMLICQACPRFERQILTLRNATRQWRNHIENDEPEQR
jgi:hypothetical protein